MRIACFRVFYGEDFLVDGVRSVLPFVDRVIVLWSDRPWGDPTPVSVRYLGEDRAIGWVEDRPVDGWRDRLEEAGLQDRVKLVRFHTRSPRGYWTKAWPVLSKALAEFLEVLGQPMVETGPHVLMLLESDHVWLPQDLDSALREFTANRYRAATSRQVELWKGGKWRVPERPYRTGSVFWRIGPGFTMPPTRSQGEPTGTDFQLLSAPVMNLGFCVSEKTMLLKHLCALGFSGSVRDSRPREDWLERVWKRWEPGMRDLEIAEGHEHTIPTVLPWDGEVPSCLS